MIALHGRLSRAHEGEPYIARVSTNPALPRPLRSTELLLADSDLSLETRGFRGVLARSGGNDAAWPSLPPELDYLSDGDVVRVSPAVGQIRVVYRRSSDYNSLFVTERCNSRCLMCSQPPREVDDGYLVSDLFEAIPLMDPATKAIGFTGGEITLLHGGFIDLVRATKIHLPAAQVDVLTNGRLLSHLRYAERLAAVRHPNLILCVPLYSDVDTVHDFVVQAEGAFDQTVRALLNLARVGVAVEVRVVLHQVTVPRLQALAEFMCMNLPFVSHVALMGLEITGFTKANLQALWIDPFDYQAELTAAVETLDSAGIPTSIYNHPLCLLPRALWPFARKSISDWKNVYHEECDECSRRAECGGFFASSSVRRSAHIAPFVAD